MTRRILPLVSLSVLLAATSARAAEVSLDVIQYPDRRSVDVPFAATNRAPPAPRSKAR
jgi:hypothetical protein